MHLIFLQGYAGVGKSTLAQRLSRRLGFLHIDRDNLGTKHVADEDIERVLAYQQLRKRIHEEIGGRHKGIVLDAPFLRELKENRFHSWVQPFSVPYSAIWVAANPQERKRRRQRRKAPHDIYDLDTKIEEDEKVYPRPLGLPWIPADLISAQSSEEAILYLSSIEGRDLALFSQEDSLEEVWRLQEKTIISLPSLRRDEKRVLLQTSHNKLPSLLPDLYLARKDGELIAAAALSPGKREEAVVDFICGDALALSSYILSEGEKRGYSQFSSFASFEVGEKYLQPWGFAYFRGKWILV